MSRSFHRSSSALFAAVTLAASLLMSAPAAFAGDDAWTLGVQAFHSGDFDDAATHIAEVVDAKPDWHGGHLMLGHIRLKQERAQDALEALNRAHELAPTDVSVRLALGQAALSANSFEQAITTLAGSRPDGLNDQRWLLWQRVRGEAAIGAGQHAAALADFESVLKTADDADLRWKASNLARHTGDAAAETRHLKAGERLAKNDGRFLARRLKIGLASALTDEADAKTAACARLAGDARKLTRMSKESAHLLLAGRALGCAGHDDAATVLSRAVQAAPDNADAAYHLGRQQALDESFAAAEATLTPLAQRSDLETARHTRVLDLLGYSVERQQRFDEALAIYSRGGLTARIAAAKKAKAIHVANQEAEAKAAKAQELINKINDIEGQLAEGGLR